jgi:hypothetical protein
MHVLSKSSTYSNVFTPEATFWIPSSPGFSKAEKLLFANVTTAIKSSSLHHDCTSLSPCYTASRGSGCNSVILVVITCCSCQCKYRWEFEGVGKAIKQRSVYLPGLTSLGSLLQQNDDKDGPSLSADSNVGSHDLLQSNPVSLCHHYRQVTSKTRCLRGLHGENLSF